MAYRPTKRRKIEPLTSSALDPEVAKFTDLPPDLIADVVFKYLPVAFFEPGYWKGTRLFHWGKFVEGSKTVTVEEAGVSRDVEIIRYGIRQIHHSTSITGREFIEALRLFIEDKPRFAINKELVLPVMSRAHITQFVLSDQDISSPTGTSLVRMYHGFYKGARMELSVFKAHLKTFVNAIFDQHRMSQLQHVSGSLWTLLASLGAITPYSSVRRITCGPAGYNALPENFPTVENCQVTEITRLYTPLYGQIGVVYENVLIYFLNGFPHLRRLHFRSRSARHRPNILILGDVFRQYMVENSKFMLELSLPNTIVLDKPMKPISPYMGDESAEISHHLPPVYNPEKAINQYHAWVRQISGELRITAADTEVIAPQVHHELKILRLNKFKVSQGFVTPHNVTFKGCLFTSDITELSERTEIASFTKNCKWARFKNVTIRAKDTLVELTLSKIRSLDSVTLDTPMLKRAYFIRLQRESEILIRSTRPLDLLHIDGCVEEDLIIKSLRGADVLELVFGFPTLIGFNTVVEELLLDRLPMMEEFTDQKRFEQFTNLKKVIIKDPRRYEDIDELKRVLGLYNKGSIDFTVKKPPSRKGYPMMMIPEY